MTWRWEAPAYLAKANEVRDLVEMVSNLRFSLSPKMAVAMPREIADTEVRIGEGVYRMGIGGLHSSESNRGVIPGAGWTLSDFDVTSYYPSIISGLGLYPEHLGSRFLDVYRTIIVERVKAKREGNNVMSEVYKLVLNGSFGKFGSQYSPLFSPQLLTQVTMTGQLALLLLIHRLEAVGARVVSANTDGVTVLHRENVESVIHGWQAETGFNLERVDYKALHSRDVNNYVAIKTDGSVKGKGLFTTAGLTKNPDFQICAHAVRERLANGTSVWKTISECKDVRQFLRVRTVKGGAIWDWDRVGKVVRWYRSIGGDTIHYENGNMVADSEHAVVLQDLPDVFPGDVDLDWYFRRASDLLHEVGGA
jgi:hypothetical protein